MLMALEFLFAEKGNPNIQNLRGGTPIMLAASMKRHFSVDLIKLLLHYGADINMVNN